MPLQLTAQLEPARRSTTSSSLPIQDETAAEDVTLIAEEHVTEQSQSHLGRNQLKSIPSHLFEDSGSSLSPRLTAATWCVAHTRLRNQHFRKHNPGAKRKGNNNMIRGGNTQAALHTKHSLTASTGSQWQCHVNIADSPGWSVG